MGYALLWVENLIVLLLLMALIVACVGHLYRRWLRIVLWVSVLLTILSVYALQTVFAAVLQFRQDTAMDFWPPKVHWFWQILALTLAFFVGSLWLSIRGLRPVDATTVPTVAGSWPRGRLAIVLGVAVALHLMTFWNFDSTLRQQMSTARAEAGVLALSVAPPRVPDHDNAAIIYEQAAPALLTMDWDKITRANGNHAANTTQGWPFDTKDPGLRPFLQRHAATIALLHKAASKPGCYFEHDYCRPEMDMGVDFRETQSAREFAMLLVLDARTKAADGDAHGAMQDINAIFAMSQHLGAEPITGAFFTSLSIEHHGVETLQHVLLETSVSSDDLAAIGIEDATSHQKQVARVLSLDEAIRLAAFCDIASRREGGTVGERIMGPLDSVWRVLLFADTLTEHGRVSRQLREMVAQPYYKTRAQWKSLLDKAALAHADFLTRVFVPADDVFVECAAMHDAWREVACLGVAAERYRLRHGKFPAQLDELVPDFIPAVPLDPFDGKPMRLKRTEHGIVIYSIGPDLVDDGGTPLKDYDPPPLKGDITFELSDREP